MEKIETRAIKKYVDLKGIIALENHEYIVRALAENAHLYATVTHWISGFKRGQNSIESDHRSRNLPTAVNKQTGDFSLRIFMSARGTLCCQIVEGFGISHERVDKNLTYRLGFSKDFTKCVLRFLTAKQKRTICTVSNDNLDLFKAFKYIFLAQFISEDEAMVPYYQSYTKNNQPSEHTLCFRP